MQSVKKLSRKIKRKVSAERADTIRKLKRGMEEDDEHRRVLNACIYPFAHGDIPGHYFVRAAPLSELNPPVENLDFLIVCAEPQRNEISIAIIGEAKGSIDNPEPIVTETKQRKVVFENNWQYAKDNYLNSQELPREFVLGVLSIDANEVAKSVIRKGGHIVVWSVDFSNDPVISLHRPDLERPEREIRETMFHTNSRLNQVLDKLPTSQSYKTFYEQSHVIAKLRILTGVDKGKALERFSLDDVRTLVKEALDYVTDPAIIDRESQAIVNLALRIGFIKDVGSGQFKIMTRSKHAGSREIEIERMWISSRINEMQKKLLEDGIAEIQHEFELERKKRPTLDESVAGYN